MRLNNIVTQTQSQPGPGAGWFGCEEGLEDFIPDLFWDTGAVVLNTYSDLTPALSRGEGVADSYCYLRLLHLIGQ